jgi:hypothetical protein
MAENQCQFCKKAYNNSENTPMILDCGDSCCSSCIKKFEEILSKDEFECSLCCHNTKSSGIKNKQLIPKGNASNCAKNLKASIRGEFEIYIRIKSNTGSEKFSIFVTKEMTIGELKEKIQNEKGFDSSQFDLAFRKPLTQLNQTLEYYRIVKTVTITQISNVHGGKLFSIFKK